MMAEREFEFDLVFALPDSGLDEGALLDAFHEAGCDDAVVGLGRPGFVGLAFIRAGQDPEAVIVEAVGQAAAALPEGAELREVWPDLVSLADVAARLRVTRQALQKRPMPPPSLGGLYRASEMPERLLAGRGKLRDRYLASQAWFDAAPGAQRVNAKIGLGEFVRRPETPKTKAKPSSNASA